MALVGAGAVNHEQLVELGHKAFGSLPAQFDQIAREKPSFTGSMITERDDTMGVAHVALAVEGVGWSHPDYYAFLVLQTMVGSWDRSVGGGKNLSSRLCEKVATENLVHSLTTFNTSYSQTGLFGSYLVAPGGERLEDAVYEVFNEYNRIGKNVSKDEVERAKNKLKASILMNLDGTTAVAEDIGRQILTYGRRLTPAEIFTRIDAVSQDDIRRIVKDHCEDVCPAVAGIGATEELPDYNQIRGWTYWMRW
jgi:processing peptidase subunit beta